jgi:hypothetical protein
MRSEYISKIKKSIKELNEQGYITKRYKFQSFCDNFISDDKGCKYEEFKPRDRATTKCMCGHAILYNFKYKHKTKDDFFVLGSCCIKKFSTHYRKQRECKICNEPIRKNKTNMCETCDETEQQRITYEKTRLKLIRENEDRCRCKKCGTIKKDSKYKLCYTCKFGESKKTYKKCNTCGKDKKEDNYKRCYKCNKSNRYDPIEDNIRVALDSWD